MQIDSHTGDGDLVDHGLDGLHKGHAGLDDKLCDGVVQDGLEHRKDHVLHQYHGIMEHQARHMGQHWDTTWNQAILGNKPVEVILLRYISYK